MTTGMTTGAWCALALFGLLAVADWVSRAAGNQRLEYLTKPTALGALIGVALLLDPADPARRGWFVAALICSLAGDVFLMLPGDRFVAGLAAFLCGHVAYLVGLNVEGPSMQAVGLAAVVVAAAVVPLTLRILGSLREGGHGALAGPVGLYITVISAMLAFALASGNALAGAGAALFVWSDAMIAWNRFVRPFGWAAVAIMVTYHLGQAGLTLSLLP